MSRIKSIAYSVAIHFLLISLMVFFVRFSNNKMLTVDIDMANSSLLLRPENAVMHKNHEVPELWFEKITDVISLKKIRDNLKRVKSDIKQSIPCPYPCPENPGDWILASASSRKPEWINGFITEKDYPPDARKQGIEGNVRVEVFIDASGKVKAARIVEATDVRFAEAVKKRIKDAVFKPALDKNGNPVAVKMLLPVIFELN